jgi:mono/diheme cytochrome c family protein
MHHHSAQTFLRILLFVVISCGFAAAGMNEKPLDGKTLYRTNCKVCHDKGSPHKQYTPMTLTQDQWRKFYSTKLIPSHKSVVEPKSGKKLLELLSPDQIKSIQRFCIDHAADSEQPATCG